MNCCSFVLKAVLCEYKFDNKRNCTRVLCDTIFTTLTYSCQSPEPVLCEDKLKKSSLLQVCQEAKAVLREHKLNNNHFTDRKYLLCNFWRTHWHMHWKKKEINQHWRSPTCRCQSLSVEPGGSVFPGRQAGQGGQVPPLLDHHHFHPPFHQMDSNGFLNSSKHIAESSPHGHKVFTKWSTTCQEVVTMFSRVYSPDLTLHQLMNSC